MDAKSELQGKRRFYFYLIFSIIMGSVMFYSGFQIGKMVGREDLQEEILNRKEMMDDRIGLFEKI